MQLENFQSIFYFTNENFKMSFCLFISLLVCLSVLNVFVYYLTIRLSIRDSVRLFSVFRPFGLFICCLSFCFVCLSVYVSVFASYLLSCQSNLFLTFNLSILSFFHLSVFCSIQKMFTNNDKRNFIFLVRQFRNLLSNNLYDNGSH